MQQWTSTHSLINLQAFLLKRKQKAHKYIPGAGFEPGALDEVTVGGLGFGESPLVSPASEYEGAGAGAGEGDPSTSAQKFNSTRLGSESARTEAALQRLREKKRHLIRMGHDEVARQVPSMR